MASPQANGESQARQEEPQTPCAEPPSAELRACRAELEEARVEKAAACRRVAELEARNEADRKLLEAEQQRLVVDFTRRKLLYESASEKKLRKARELVASLEEERNELRREVELECKLRQEATVRHKDLEGQLAELTDQIGALQHDAGRFRQTLDDLRQQRLTLEKPTLCADEVVTPPTSPILERRNFSMSHLGGLDAGGGYDGAGGIAGAAVGSRACADAADTVVRQFEERQSTPMSRPLRRNSSISVLQFAAGPTEKAQLRRGRPCIKSYVPDRRDVPVVIVTSEINPWSKTGGLAMVTASFAYEFAVRGRRTWAISPMYQNYANVTCVGETAIWLNGASQKVRYYHQAQEYGDGCVCDFLLVDHECYHRSGGIYCSDMKTGREYKDNLFRFGLLCLAALEAPLNLSIRGQPPLGERVVFIANDWQAGLVPVYLLHRYRQHGRYRRARTLFVVHNMGYQGRYPLRMYPPGPVLGLDDAATTAIRFDGNANLCKGALVTADRVITVSPNYALEIQTPLGGFGLDQIVRSREDALVGIRNGIDDSWDPRTDAHIAQNYTLETFEAGKRVCKAALQKSLRLRVEPRLPLVGFVGRLTHQKGVDLIGAVVPWLMKETGNCVTGHTQLVMMGDGEQCYCDMLVNAERQNPGVVRGFVGFDPVVEHQMMAGCDLLVMPSRYEPCGLPQMYCQAYGTLPVVHSTGGLKDSVDDFSSAAEGGGDATGFLVEPLSENDMKRVLYLALETYVRQPEVWLRLQRNAMSRDFYWPRAIDEYEREIDKTLSLP
eukprot:TRINITY_DN55844_c0_g1_i1.p1 TRINITY_DN55844_c0_g1~~TRINITY_DN55844_c0_g1_i1.p1  ORF type:complete len:805 (-),score=160.04 TRINITY_DN55844_c0_g1_i1:55-2400(-)